MTYEEMKEEPPFYEELTTRGAHPVARKYAGVLARGLRPRAGGG